MSAAGFLRKLVRVVPPVDLAFSACEAIAELIKADPEEVKKALELDPALIGLDFGEAIEALKEGKKVARSGWNGNGLFVFKQVPSPIDAAIVPKMTSLPQSVKDEFVKRGQGPNYCNQMAIVKPDGSVDSWVASSADTFAEDWEIVK